MTAPLDIEFLGFDVFGTVVDWRSGIARAAEPFLHRHAIDLDPHLLADEWRSLYQPAMEPVRSGARPWTTLDVLNRENLETVLIRHGVDIGVIAGAELADLNGAWERLDPWPDTVAALHRLKQRYAIGALSNGHVALMLNLARFGGLPWDVITGAEVARTYKPMPQVYLRSASMVGRRPDQCAMVAAHNDDLHAARAVGMRTVFVHRPFEHGPGNTTDLAVSEPWDVVAGSLDEVADTLGCA